MALDKLVDSSVLDAAMRYTANRIRAKTGGSENIPFDMSAETPKGFGDAVDTISGGGDTNPIEPPLNEVVFVDYDGTIVQEYTAAEFLSLTAMPQNPSHNGLTAQGWNWSLADAQEYVADNGGLVIGQNYTTSDGKTRIYIYQTEITVAVPVYILMTTTVKNGVTINWGDGATTVTWANANASGTYSHKYAVAGDYVIEIGCTSGTYKLGYNGANKGIFFTDASRQSNASAKTIFAIELGDNLTELFRQGFVQCSNLKTITIPTTITSFGGTNGSLFGGSAIRCIILPSGVTSYYGSFSSSTKFFSVPKSLTYIGNLNSSGQLRAVTLPSQAVRPAATIQGARLEKVIVPGSYTTIGDGAVNTFVSYTSFLQKLTIPATVTTIKDYALMGNYSMQEIHFLSTTPPTLANSRALGDMPVATFYVPYSEDHSILDAYKAATNWATYASRIQEEPQ